MPLLAVAALVTIIVVRYRQQDTSTRPAADADHAAAAEWVIQLEIDFGDGAEKRFTKLPWHADMTVADAMELAAAHPRGLRYTLVGAGSNALLVSIDGLKNEGGGTSSRNWIYRVNGERADRSCGDCRLQPWDTVLWSFMTYE